MRRTIAATLIAVGASICLLGCSAKTSAKIPTGADLKGTWNQSGTGYEMGRLVTWKDQRIVIDTVDGQAFTGFKEYTPEGKGPQKELVNGAIGVSGDIVMTDEDGVFQGRLIDGRVQGIYAEIGADAATINVELSKK